MNRYYPPQPKRKTPLSAINAWCRHCLGETYDAETYQVYTDGIPPRDCENKFCPLWPYRTGRSPRKTKPVSAEHKAVLVERLAKGRAAKSQKNSVDNSLNSDATPRGNTDRGENLRLI